ncbi:MAG: hypothetical protein HQL51_13850 [Magnetococcales bacterium]|nr:hypothetical protein [Magnetococcales bacterium]
MYKRFMGLLLAVVVPFQAIAVSDHDLDRLDRSSPSETVKYFVEQEFNRRGSTRYDVASFSAVSKVAKKNKDIDGKFMDNDHTYGKDLHFGTDELIVVRRFDIEKIYHDGDRGVAIVHYDQVVSSNGAHWDRDLFLDLKKYDRVIYLLHRDREDNYWYIVDPPTWRVSYDYLLEAYPSYLKHMGWTSRTIHPDPSQKNLSQIMHDDLDFLRSIEKTVREHQK